MAEVIRQLLGLNALINRSYDTPLHAVSESIIYKFTVILSRLSQN